MADLRLDQEPVEEVWSAQIRTSDEGRPRLHMEAPVMRKFQHEDSSYVRFERDTSDVRIVVRLFDEQGMPSAVIHADEVIHLEDEGRFDVRGDVQVVTVEDKRLESEQLRWYEKERLIRSGGFVRIETPTEQLSGYDLEADENLDTYRLERVTGRATLRED